MPFTQIDANTVADDQGNVYSFPFPGNPGAPPGMTPPAGAPPGQVSAMGPDLGPQPTPPPPTTQYTQLPSSLQPVDPYADSTPGPGSQPSRPDFAVPLQTKPNPLTGPAAKAAFNTARNDAILNNPEGFAAAGGVAKTDEDYARMAGGLAQHQTQTAEAEMAAKSIIAQSNIEKMRTQAAMVMQTAEEYDKHVASLQADAKSRWTDWKKRNDAAAAQLIDPRHAFTNGGTLSKINWSLYMLGAGLQGGQSVDNALNMMNKFVEDDVNVQKLNLDNKRKSLEDEKGYLTEQDKTGKDQLAEWYFAKNLRLQAVGQAMDAKISELGRPAAMAAGLLSARDAIEKELLKGQEHVGNHFFEEAQNKSKQAHEVYMARLQSQLRMSEDMFKHKLTKDKNDTLPANTPLGLQILDKRTGQSVPMGQIPLKVKGDKAVEAGGVLAASNEEGSQLREVKADLENMSTADLLRGGTPQFKAKVKDLIQARAMRDNGKRISDADIPRAAQEEFGVKMGDSAVSNTVDAIRGVGEYRQGVLGAIDDHLRNLSVKTMNKLQPYIDSDFAQNYDVQFNPQSTSVEKPGSSPDDMNTALTKAAGGADVSDLAVPGPRSPVTKDEPLPLSTDTSEYDAERAKGRGVQGGLPRLLPREEAKVEQATASFAKAPADDVLRLAQAYLKDKTLSPEAKHEIRLESIDAFKRAQEVELSIIDQAQSEYQKTHHVLTDENTGAYGPEPVTDKGAFTKEFKEYLSSDIVNDMRRRAGLEPRPR